MRRWVAVAGIVVAVTAGTAATARELAAAEFEAEVSLQLELATPWQAAQAANAYASSYVDVRRGQIQAEAAAATETVKGMAARVESQLLSAEEPRRASLVGALERFNQQLDRLQLDMYGPGVVGSTPARPVGDGALYPGMIAALGATVAVGAAVSARRPPREVVLR